VKFQWLIPTSSLLTLLMVSYPADAAKLQSWRFDSNSNQLEFSTDDAVQPQAQLIYNPTRLVIDLPGINFDEPTITRQLGGAIRSIRVGQLNDRTTRLVVELNPGYTIDPKQVRVQGTSPKRWMVQLPTPQRDQSSHTDSDSDPIVTNVTNATAIGSIATIESVELNGTQLVIRGNDSFTYTSGWDRVTGLFRITIPNATLARAVKGPDLSPNSPVQRIRLQQPDSRTVVIYIQPAARVQVGGINQLSSQMVALELRPLGTPSASTSYPSFPQQGSSQATARIGQKRVLVMLDPGHGGIDSGAVGINGLEEKNVILPISLKVASILRENGVDAELTRDSDYFVDLAPRVEMAKRDHVDLFVSIHANSVDNKSSVNGLETYYFDSGLRLAQTVHRVILQKINVRDRSVRRARFYVLRKNPMPAILIETGYVTGVEDSPRLATREYQDQMADAIARGILEYIRENF